MMTNSGSMLGSGSNCTIPAPSVRRVLPVDDRPDDRRDVLPVRPESEDEEAVPEAEETAERVLPGPALPARAEAV